MGRSALPCFRLFSITGQNSPNLLPQDACNFFHSLSEDLRKLEQSLTEGSVSLRWSAEAMNLLKKMQIQLLALLKKSNLPISFGAEEDWFNQYMQETVTLLDFCNSLKSAVSGINRYRMVIDLTTQRLIKDKSTCMASLNDLEFEMLQKEHVKSSNACLTKETVNVGNGIGCAGGKRDDKSITAIMLAAKSTMLVISLLLVSAIVSPLSIEIRSGDLVSKFPQLKPFMDRLTALVVRFRATTANGSNSVLVESALMSSVLGDMKSQVVQGVLGDKEREKFSRSVDLLRTSSDELREGIEKFDAAVDEVFELVIRGRDEMLGLFKFGALPMG